MKKKRSIPRIPLHIRHAAYKISAYEKSVLEQKGDESLVEVRNSKGEIEYISIPDKHWQWYGNLNKILPKGHYYFPTDTESKPSQKNKIDFTLVAMAFYLGAYEFGRYRKSSRATPSVSIEFSGVVQKNITPLVQGITLSRDLINMPANDMGPEELANEAEILAKEFNGKITITSGEKLQKEYPLVHMVGQGAEERRAPRFVEIHFKSKNSSKTVALVGKGVCFDSGGLDIKPESGMLLMKKDMGGAAIVLGLAKALLLAKIPLNISLYLPLVENAVGSRAMRPLDIIKSRKGTTVEIGNTDAEGRLILADALTRACEDTTDLIIDIATLTGAARVAVGAEISAFFTNNAELASSLYAISDEVDDPMWQLPLYHPYGDSIKGKQADLNNISPGGYGGAITAALFLEHFVTHPTPWIHIDTMAWNIRSRPSYPEGGEAMGLRALFRYLKSFATG